MAENTPVCDFGWQAPDFTLPATDGKTYSLGDISGPKGVLMMFICNHCPYVKSIIDRIADEGAALKEIGIGVTAICANDAADYPEDSFENMARVAESNGFTFPYLHDESQQVAQAYGAVCTPDFFGFDKDGGLQYRGRLDSSGRERAPDSAPRELYEGMKLVAETGAGPLQQTPSIGCSIKWRA